MINFPRITMFSRFKKQSLTSVIPQYRRLIFPVVLCVFLMQLETRNIVLTVLSDAFWQVSVFVAMTLSLYHFFVGKISSLYVNKQGEKSAYKEIITASLMGVMPGCGGAIIVMTQYVSGKMSFGAVVAVLTATMGDAAFLLLAAQPVTGVGLVLLCFCVGLTSGVVVNKLHGPNFLRHTVKSTTKESSVSLSKEQIPNRLKYQGLLWQWIMIPGTVIGLLMAGQVDITQFLSISSETLKYMGAIISLGFIFLWASTREANSYESIVAEDKKEKQSKAFQKVALDTNFVTCWVVAALLIFELVMFYGNLKLDNIFNQFGALAPLMGVFVGMIPGCGPQIITTSLYLSGAIPFSAQIGNAISNDGDALFPAIALSPRVAIIATLYSSIPALITAYTYYWCFE